MYAAGDQERIERVGFSMLDMKTYLAARGLPSDGYRIDLERLAKASIPAIALIDVDGYRHFVIVKGIADGGVLLGDPARGTRVVTRERFAEIWNGIAFVLKSDVAGARDTFNRPTEWAIVPPTPYGSALNRTSLATVTASTFRAGRIYGFGR
jgi:predicted double-glycine peptidase